MTDPLYDSRNPNYGRTGGLRDQEPRSSAGSAEVALSAIEHQLNEMGSLKGWRLSLIRENVAKLRAALSQDWLGMSSAPRDRTPILLKFKDRIPDEREHVRRWDGLIFVGRNYGDIQDWGFAAPVGMGGFPDEWLEGWRHLSNVAQPTLDHETELSLHRIRELASWIERGQLAQPRKVGRELRLLAEGLAAQPPAAPVERLAIVCTCRGDNDCDGSCQCPPPAEYLDKIAYEKGIDAALEAARTPVARSSAGSVAARCPTCGWCGGGIRDEGCLISPCPRHVTTEPQTSWQPIETAPTDGTKVLLRFDGPFNDTTQNGITTGQYLSGGWWLNCIWASSTAHYEPVAWAPIPSLVTRPQSGGQG